PEEIQGGDLRCFYHPDIGFSTFNKGRDFDFDFSCDGPVIASVAKDILVEERLAIPSFITGQSLSFECLDCFNKTYVVFSITGQMVTKGSLMPGLNTIRFRNLQKGLYLLQIDGGLPYKFVGGE
ncbi:MAG: hypothetical protein AAGF89_14245, partial [Bacteroidota bacterium]